MSCDGAPSCPTNQELVCWFILPTPCLRRHPPNLIPFGFRAEALNSHSSFISNGPATDEPSFEPEPWPLGAFRGLRGPPGACKGCCLRGPREAEGLRCFFWLLPYRCLAARRISAFSSHLQKGLASGRPERPCGLGFLNNLVITEKEKGFPRRGSCPSTWRCSSRSKSLFRLA